MKIKHEKGNKEAWVCTCGNVPSDSGFYACDKDGNEIEPDINWDGKSYVCGECGQIINGNTLEIIGKKGVQLKLR